MAKRKSTKGQTACVLAGS